MGICQGKGIHENTSIKPLTAPISKPDRNFQDDHSKLTPAIIKEWQGYARKYPRFWSDPTKTKQ